MTQSVIAVQRWLVRSGHIRKWGSVAIDDLKLIVKRGLGSNESEPQIWVRVNRDNKGFGKWKKKGLGKMGERVTTLTFGGFGSAEDWQFEFCCIEDCDVELQGALVKVTSLG